ncbi:MAG: FAD-dependent oxidoreductase [Chloracidobacterium sp.]|nr:FAD-dependent oxidoreductase [Chloracidobacterium sp.]MDW8216366.1 FAD-dependent oxidoreductase [Acidobacteriota bacterium]
MDVAVIGAGLAGLTAAYTLTQRGFNCEVLEKSRALGGRMATRRHLGAVIDHGAQYFTVKTAAFAGFLREIGVVEAMQPLAAPVIGYPFQSLTAALAEAAQEVSSEGREFPYRYVFRLGMTTLAKAIVQRLGEHRVIRECFVEAVAWDAAARRWTLHTRGDNTTLGGIRQADWVVLALPAPQAAQLLARSQPLPASLAALQRALENIPYYPCLTVIWGAISDGMYPGVGALRATAGHYAIGWLAWLDRLAPQRVPSGMGVGIAQFAPQASRVLLDQPEGVVVQALAIALNADLHIDLPTLQWVQIKQWRYANPAATLTDLSLLTAAAEFQLEACGDYFLGGRVEAAFLSGLAAADRLCQRVGR